MLDGRRGPGDTVLSTAFRLIEGRVGCRHELCRVAFPLGFCDPEAGRDPDRDSLGGQQRPVLEVVADPLGELDGPVGVGRGQDEQELLAAPARGDVDVA